MKTEVDWIAVDWGTSNLRAWAMDIEDAVLKTASSVDGMSNLAPSEFEAALLNLINDWISDSQIDVIACGMVGAKQGWVEAKYREVPCNLSENILTRAPANDPRIRVHVVPGIKQPDPADVMRGEETQIAGFLAQNKDFDGVLCLPGTHTKWVHISAEEVVSFQSYLTGELFELIASQSVLRHSVDAKDIDADAFAAALDIAMSKPEKLAARLFTIRAESLLNDLGTTAARSRLSGLLLGAELAAARPYWLGQPVVIIGSNSLGDLYNKALNLQGLSPTIYDVAQATLNGLSAIRKLQRLGK